ncbi:arginase-1 [Culicoides brevitarsis]|uniref:arginase-1 n=1 Tax=Culicoides brevitarsis TaxID=469753 RepID=UPI00307C30A4
MLFALFLNKNVARNCKVLQNTMRLYSGVVDKRKVGVIGVPFYKGQPNAGVDLGPKILRENGKLISVLREQTKLLEVKDYGDISYEPININSGVRNLKNLPDVAGMNKSLSDKVYQILSEGRVCLTLGGDHSMGIGTVDGHLRYDPDTVVFWVDAHADLNTNTTSPTGNIHGMPLSFLLKELTNTWSDVAELKSWLTAKLPCKNLVYVALRDVDAGEQKFIEDLGIQAYGMREIDRYGIRNVMTMALEKVDPMQTKRFHCSFDIDSLDAREAPSTGTRVRGGLTLREGLQIVEQLYDTGRLDALDLTEVNPAIGDNTDVATTVRAAIAIIAGGVGGNRYAYK